MAAEKRHYWFCGKCQVKLPQYVGKKRIKCPICYDKMRKVYRETNGF
jgi:hypothetical protein